MINFKSIRNIKNLILNIFKLPTLKDVIKYNNQRKL